MPVTLQDTLKFAELMLKFQEVIRKVQLPRRPGIQENDVEHSYQLAMMGWYLNASGDLGMNSEHIIKYALVHDLAEVHAGDVHILDHAGRVGKEEREAAAVVQIADEFPDFPEVISLIHAYEARTDDESQFVYALDKLMPMIMIYMEGGSSWHELDFGMEELLANKAEKTAGSPVIAQLNAELSQLVRARPDLFPRP